jgi:uncharacterized protein (TIGR03437 family)
VVLYRPRIVFAVAVFSAIIPGGASLAVAADADAVAISSVIQARHLPYGTVMDPVFAAPGSTLIVSYTRCGDSAIWTGHYLAAEAFRYKVARSPDALANVKSAVAGLKSLVDVTGNNLLARCVVPLSSPYAQSIISEEQHNGIYTNSAAGLYWIGNTSRDQYSGVFFGLGIAFDMVDDAAVKASAADLLTRLLDYLQGHAWTVFMPDGTPSTTFAGRADQQLSFLKVGSHVNPSKFSNIYDFQKLLLSLSVLAPIALEVQSNGSYFKFNLDSINLYNLIRLDSSSVYAPAYTVLRNHTRDQQNAFFNMIDRALEGPNSGRDAETVAMLEAWLQRPKRDVFVDLRGKQPACNSPDEACSPVPVAQRPTTDFLWQRNPYQLDGGGSGTVESAGIDYILPYWMARFYGVESGIVAVSAATGNGAISTESIASIYGANLTNSTAVADKVPLPTILAGISVQVTDSAGIARLAPIFFASPAQINFEIPAGAALGAATFSVLNSAGATVASTTDRVQSISPGVFTADGSGKGVAAALAVRQIAGITTSAPIFRCSTTGCTSVPIDLGVDTPTYLSLYGTGIRNLSALSNVSVIIKGIAVPVQYAGPQGFYSGLDQVNVALPLSLRGTGDTDLVLTVDGQPANTVRVNIQ